MKVGILKDKQAMSYNSILCLLSDRLESRRTQRRHSVSERLLLFLHSGFGCRGFKLSAVRRWEIGHGYIFPVGIRVGGKVVVLDVMRMDALAHRLVCPGIVNAQRISAAVEAAPAALCRPVSRGWEKKLVTWVGGGYTGHSKDAFIIEDLSIFGSQPNQKCLPKCKRKYIYPHY